MELLKIYRDDERELSSGISVEIVYSEVINLPRIRLIHNSDLSEKEVRH